MPQLMMVSCTHKFVAHIYYWFKNVLLSVKQSYYKLARLYHPDRVATSEKEEAGEKFNLIHNAYCILSDASKKAQYDSGYGVIFTKATAAARWENYLKPVNADNVNEAKNKYQGSNEEKSDLIRELKIGKGSMTHLLNNIPFMRIEDENRMIEIAKKLMDNGEIPKISIKKIKK